MTTSRNKPYLIKIEQPGEIEFVDFPSVFSDQSTSGRLGIWQNGLKKWREQPLLGIGSGVFGLHRKNGKQYNLPNILLQVLIDSGVIGLAVFLLLLIRLLWRKRRYSGSAIIIAALGSLMFDNIINKSMAWVLWVVWLVWAFRALLTQAKTA